jgi:hypothetical protein
MKIAVEVRNSDCVEATEIARSIDAAEHWCRRVWTDDTVIFVFDNWEDAWALFVQIPVRLRPLFRLDV